MKYAYISLIAAALILTIIRTYSIFKWSRKNGYDKESYERFLASEAGVSYGAYRKAITALLALALFIYLIK